MAKKKNTTLRRSTTLATQASVLSQDAASQPVTWSTS